MQHVCEARIWLRADIGLTEFDFALADKTLGELFCPLFETALDLSAAIVANAALHIERVLLAVVAVANPNI